jgi:dCMP deaminase
MGALRDKDYTFMTMAWAISVLATCSRRQVGCLLTDSKNRIIGSGYNGVPSGIEHCVDKPCPMSQNPHGSSCFATHAEVNAIAQCKNVDDVYTVYTTSFPCIECFKLIMNTGCSRIVYAVDYPSSRKLVEELNSNAKRPIELIQRTPYVDASGTFVSTRP